MHVDTPENETSLSERNPNPIEAIKLQIMLAKDAIAQCESAQKLDERLGAIQQSIVALCQVGNPQCVSPLMQQYLSLIETKPSRQPSGESVIVMVKRLGYTPEFVKLYAKLLDEAGLNSVVQLMAKDPLLISDLKTSRMAIHLAKHSRGEAICDLLDRLLEQCHEKSGPNLLQAINEYLGFDDCRADLICDLIIRHKPYLWSIPEYKIKTVGVTGIGFLSPKAAVVIHQRGYPELAKEVAQVMCREAHDANHYYFLAQIGAAPEPVYFDERFAKRHLFAEDIGYAIQNPSLPLPVELIESKLDSAQQIRKIIEHLPQLILPSDDAVSRLLEVIRVLTTDHAVNKKFIVNSKLPRSLLCRVDSLRDSVFSADLGV